MLKPKLIGKIILCSTLIFSSCEKRDFGKENLTPQNQNSSNEAVLAVSNNSGNPNDHLGNQHNHALNEVAAQSDFPDSLNGNEVYSAVKGMLKDSLSGSYFLTYSETQNDYQKFIDDTAQNKGAIANLKNTYFTDYLIDETALSSNANGYLNELANDYQNFQSVSDLEGDLISLENDAKGDTTLSNSEQELLTGLMAIARNSLIYWDHVLGNAAHDWHQPFTNNLASSKETDLMLNMSLASACSYGLVFHSSYDGGGYSIADSHSSGVTQASVVPGPATIADIEM